MSGEMVDIEMPDGVADAYLARPDDGKGHPGVLLVMDVFGLRPQIERMADRVADAGYLVLAPNVFYRAGRSPIVSTEGLDDPQRRAELLKRLRPTMRNLTPDRCARDGEAYLDFLEKFAPGPVGVSGYCMGGRVGWHIAAAHPERVAALGAFHTGGMVTADESSPHLRAGQVRAELFFGHADRDVSMTKKNIAELERALEAAGLRYRSELFEGGRHGYTMADTSVYHEPSAERHYDELIALLDRTIGV